MPKMTDEEFYKLFERNFRELTRNGKAPWLKEGMVERDIAINPCNGVIFRGVNSLMLDMSAAQKGYKDPRWLSADEIKDLNYNLRYKEPPTPIAYNTKYVYPVDVHPSAAKRFDKKYPKQQFYQMYNIEQLKEFEQIRKDGITIPKDLRLKKLKNSIENSKTNDFIAIKDRLNQDIMAKTPYKAHAAVAAIVQYRLAQELKIPCKPAVNKENLEKSLAMLKTDDILRAMYQSEVEKDRLFSKNRELEQGIVRTVDRVQEQQSRALER